MRFLKTKIAVISLFLATFFTNFASAAELNNAFFDEASGGFSLGSVDSQIIDGWKLSISGTVSSGQFDIGNRASVSMQEILMGENIGFCRKSDGSINTSTCSRTLNDTEYNVVFQAYDLSGNDIDGAMKEYFIEVDGGPEQNNLVFYNLVKLITDTNGGSDGSMRSFSTHRSGAVTLEYDSDVFQRTITQFVRPPAGKILDYVTVNDERFSSGDSYAVVNDTTIKFFWKDEADEGDDTSDETPTDPEDSESTTPNNEETAEDINNPETSYTTESNTISLQYIAILLLCPLAATILAIRPKRR